MYIVMTKAQADVVKGETSPGHALSPVLTADGTYILPYRVLEDEAHASKHAFLKSLPTSPTFNQLPPE